MWIKQVIPQVTASARLGFLYSWVLFLCDILAMISPVFPVTTALSHFFLPFTLHPGHHSQLLQLPLAHWGAGTQQVLRRRKHQTNLGKMTGLAGRTTLTLVSGAHTAASLAGRSNFCLCLISGLKNQTVGIGSPHSLSTSAKLALNYTVLSWQRRRRVIS